MKIIEGTSANGIGTGIGKVLGIQCLKAEHKLFPDGESYIKMPNISVGEDIVIVQSTYPPQDKHMLELFFMVDELKRAGAEHVTAAIPYLAYSRQNKQFMNGEAVSASTFMKLLYELGVRSIVTVEPHKKEVLSYFKGESKIINVEAQICAVIEKETSNPFIISPDKGGIERARQIAETLGCGYDYIDKERNLATGEVSMHGTLHADVEGYDVVIVDDMISTGGTIEQAAKVVILNGARKVTVAAAHLVMAGNAYDKIISAGVSHIYGTNTIPYPNARMIDVSEDIAKVL